MPADRRHLGLAVDASGRRLRPALPPALGPVRLRLGCRFGRFEVDWDGRRYAVRAEPGNAGAVDVRHPGAAGPVARQQAELRLLIRPAPRREPRRAGCVTHP